MEDRQLWIGYRYNSENARVDTLGGPAPAVVLNDENFSGATLGNVDTCVAINGSSLVNVECAQRLPFLCMYTYGGKSSIAVQRLPYKLYSRYWIWTLCQYSS